MITITSCFSTWSSKNKRQKTNRFCLNMIIYDRKQLSLSSICLNIYAYTKVRWINCKNFRCQSFIFLAFSIDFYGCPEYPSQRKYGLENRDRLHNRVLGCIFCYKRVKGVIYQILLCGPDTCPPQLESPSHLTQYYPTPHFYLILSIFSSPIKYYMCFYLDLHMLLFY